MNPNISFDAAFSNKLKVLNEELKESAGRIASALEEDKVLDYSNLMLSSALSHQENAIRKILKLKQAWNRAIEVVQ